MLNPRANRKGKCMSTDTSKPDLPSLRNMYPISGDKRMCGANVYWKYKSAYPPLLYEENPPAMPNVFSPRWADALDEKPAMMATNAMADNSLFIIVIFDWLIHFILKTRQFKNSCVNFVFDIKEQLQL